MGDKRIAQLEAQLVIIERRVEMALSMYEMVRNGALRNAALRSQLTTLQRAPRILLPPPRPLILLEAPMATVKPVEPVESVTPVKPRRKHRKRVKDGP